ncbi:MAG: hypothetical protein AB7E72_13785 [Lysobacterales bacterium]
MKRRAAWLSVLALALLLALGFREHLQELSWFRGAAALGGETAPVTDPGAGAKSADAAASIDAQSPNIATYAVAESGTESLSSGPVVADTDAARTTTAISPQAARVLMDDYEHEVDCEYIRMAKLPGRTAGREREWRWLPPEIAAMERQAFADALSRLGRGCPRWSDDDAAYLQRHQQRRSNATLAAQAGDLRARLVNSGQEQDNPASTLIQAMYDALLSGDPELIARIGYADMVWTNNHNRPEAGRGWLRRELWTLVACDLGLDCLPGGPTLDHYCLRTGICGYPSVEATIDQWVSDQYRQTLENQRAELLQRIRSGQVAGLFDPPPEPLAGDGP